MARIIHNLERIDYLVMILIIISLIIRFSLRSNYLDDWDSVQFALGINNYDISANVQQPHPPGYPVYIFFNRLIYPIIGDITATLTFTSALFGVLSLGMIYVLLSKLYNKTIGALSTLLISVTPAHMMFSVVAMSDMMGLFFIIAVIYLLYLGLFSEKYLYTSAFLFGITIGIRLTDIVIIVLFIAVLIYRKDIKNLLVSFVMFTLGIFLWLIPSALDAGGLRSYIEIQRAYNVASDKTYIILHGDIIGILREMDKLLIMGWTDVIHVFILISIIVIILIFSRIYLSKVDIINKKPILSNKREILLILWFGIYFIFAFFRYLLDTPRYFLPMYTPLAVLISLSIIYLYSVSQRKIIRGTLILFFTTLVFFMAYHALSTAYAIHTTIPAPVQASEYIKQHYNPDNTIVIGSCTSYRHFYYYLPNYTIKLDFILSEETIRQYLQNKTVVSERNCGSFQPKYNFQAHKIFEVQRTGYPKHEYVELFELEKANASKPPVKIP